MAVLAAVRRVLFQPITLPRLPRVPSPRLPWLRAVRRLPRQLNLNRPLTFGEGFSYTGIALFLIAAFWLFASGREPTTAYAAAACWLFKTAGWLVAGGWVLQRGESGQWPFGKPLVRTLTRFSKAICKARRRPELPFGLACSLITAWALWSIFR